MAVDSKHPSYIELLKDWEQMRHCYEGERKVKEMGERYLPATPGQLADGMLAPEGGGGDRGENGWHKYQAYKMRARFPNYVKRAVREMVGLMHGKPPVIELPPQMEPLRQRASVSGESLHTLLRRINAEQLTVGRIGLMLDLPNDPAADMPYIAPYTAERIINWDDGTPGMPTVRKLNLVVLNESQQRRKIDLGWDEVLRYRILILGELEANEAQGIYQQAVLERTTDIGGAAWIAPGLRGQELDFIPFTFINLCDPLPETDFPPLMELSDLALSIYRQSADYYLGLFAQSQDTLVLETSTPKEELDKVRVGVGAHIQVELGGSAYYVGVDSNGRPEQRMALENDRKEARLLSGEMLDATSREKESGEALRERVAAHTVTLKEIALAGAEGLQTALRQIAIWKRLDPEQVTVQANTSFTEAGLTPRDIFDLQAAREKGLPMADETMHDNLKRHFWTERTFEEETRLIRAQRAEEMARQREIFRMQRAASAPPGREREDEE